MPGWGLTVLLPQAIGVRRAREMSLTGNFMGAEEALAFGLVNHVVSHGDLLPFTRLIASDIIGNERDGVRRMLQTYKEYAAETAAWENEAAVGAQWRRTQFATEKVAERRAKIMERGRQQ
jgi:enoyl-CoA hydratase